MFKRRYFTLITPFLILLFFGSSSAIATKALSGNLPDRLHAGIYSVEGDIFVGPGQTVTFDAGVVLLFSSFTGLHVQGVLYAKGTDLSLVVLTSINDRLYNNTSAVNAAPYDWNGIDIYESAQGTKLENCSISNSVYGIRSQTDYLTIDNCTFRFNGKSDFSIKDDQKKTGTSFYSYFPPLPINAVPVIANTPSSTIQPEIKSSPILLTTRYAGLSIGVAGIAAGGYFLSKFVESKKQYNIINNASKTPDGKSKYSSQDWDDANKKKNLDALFTGTGLGLGALGTICFILSYTLDI